MFGKMLKSGDGYMGLILFILFILNVKIFSTIKCFF